MEQPSTPNPIAAEQLLAVTGLWPTEDHPNANDELASMGILDSYRARLKRWLRAPLAEDYKPSKFTAPDPPKEKSLQKKILAPLEPEEVERMANGLADPIESQMYIGLVIKAREYLDSKWVKIPVPGVTMDVFPLSIGDLYDVWALTRVLDNPETLFDELDANSLTIPMVDAWRAIYPNMSTKLDGMLEELVIEFTAKGHSLTWQQSDLFRMFRGVPLDTVIEIKPNPKGKNGATLEAQSEGAQ